MWTPSRAIINCNRFKYIILVAHCIIGYERLSSDFLGSHLVFKTGLDDNTILECEMMSFFSGSCGKMYIIHRIFSFDCGFDHLYFT